MEMPVALVTEVDAIIDSYLSRAGGSAQAALRLIIRDATADLCEAERRIDECERLVSRGYARAALAGD